MYYLFTFRSRTNALKFSESVRREGYSAEIVSTPQSIGGGCGLSVKLSDLAVGKRVLAYGRYASFTGVNQVKDFNGVLNIVKK